WLGLGRFPTPVQEVHGLGLPLWIKREDLSSPAPGLPGGNKVRKLEPILAAALWRGAAAVVTSGARGSNHLLACARYAARLGLGAICVAGPQPPSRAVEESFAALDACGARVVPVPWLPLTPLAALALALAGPRRFLVAPGGSGPRGVLGHLAAGLELGEQVAAGALPCPEEIYVAAGSGGTLAGLLLGLRLAGLHGVRLCGVQVVPWPALSPTLIALECRSALRLLCRMVGGSAPLARLPRPPRPAEIVLLQDQLGAGYGWPTEEGTAAISRLEEACGLRLEPTYTGKALAALLDQAGRRGSTKPVLFWNSYAGRAAANPGVR
ncbi:MAG: pyridoxal-phosphate dependent enzyme, partial [Deltaproteobacteria bacterium]|nr:pyridoxal-phosphate dependent enzyme [Deltaproteobacteria bacterium]